MKWRALSDTKTSSVVILAACLLLAILIGVRVLAAPTAVKFEAEVGNLTGGASSVNDAVASAGKALHFTNSSSDPGSKSFIHPGVVFTKQEIDSWTTSSLEYTRLANTCAGNLNPTGNCVARATPVVYGERIDVTVNGVRDGKNAENELNKGLKDQSGFAKVQAVLWAADGNNARREKVISYLKEFRTVTSYEWEPIEQWRLVSGWACTNLAQAAEIIDYRDAQFQRFLREVCYPVMDWSGGPNWHASFADSKLAIAAYLGDEELWQDAKLYFYEKLKQSIYVSTYDGNKVNPLHTEEKAVGIKDASGVTVGSRILTRMHTTPGTPNSGMTVSHWGGGVGAPQINSDFTLNTAYPVVDGMNAERMRDIGHVNMSYVAWVNAARTIRAQGEQLEQNAYERLLAGWGYHASRELAYLQTGTVPNPAPIQGIAGGTVGYFPAKKFFGADTPASILGMLQRAEVTGYAPAGANHFVAEAFTNP